MSRMVFEVRGVFHRNKGAVLMLEAILAVIREHFPDGVVAIAGWTENQRNPFDLWTAVPTHGAVGRKLKILASAPAVVRRAFRIVTSQDVDVILDASGFGYGDYWGLRKLEQRLVGALPSRSGQAPVVVVLPQALGPFTKPGMAEAFGEVVQRADRVWVRDRASMAYVEGLGPIPPTVQMAPDFTNLLHPALPERLDHVRGLSLLIPNEKVVSEASPERRKAYLDFFIQAALQLDAAGERVGVLIHEGAQDRQLATEILASISKTFPVIDEPSALDTKAVIGAARMVVTSRFHGLVSALSAGVPSLASGWSHKYAELLADYDCPQNLIDLDSPESWQASIGLLMTQASDDRAREMLLAAGKTQRARSEVMWDTTLSVLKARPGRSGA